MKIVEGRFYFLKNSYYDKFSDCGLMQNKGGANHNRPCFYCFEFDGLYWLVPISSKLEKYKVLYAQKIAKYNRYDGIRFGYVNGKERAFLIQNICPVTDNYIDDMYTVNHGKTEVVISKNLEKEIVKSAKRVISLHKRGFKTTITNIDTIVKGLQEEARVDDY